MFKANYKATLKTLMRSPSTILAFTAAIILICFSTFEQHGPGVVVDSAYLMRQDIWNQVRCTVWNLLPAFLGVIVASNILAEKNNGFGDLLVSNRKSLLSFYVSKILAFWTLALVVQLLFLGIWCVHYWCFQQHSVVLQFEDILRWYVINEFVYMPIGILVYSSIATFVGVVTNVPAMGAVASVAHYLLQFIFYDLKSGTNIISNYLYFIPRKIDSYTASFIDLEKTLNQVGSATLGEAIIAVLFQLSFSLLLLAVSYCLLQRKYKT